MVFCGVFDEHIRDMLGRAALFTDSDVSLRDVGVCSPSDGSRVRISQVAVDEIVSWREPLFHAHESVLSRQKKFILMLVVTGQSLLKTVHTPLLEVPN